MNHQEKKKDTESAIVREKRAEILRMARKMTPEQRKLLIVSLEKLVQNRS